MTVATAASVEGHVSRGFEPVRDAFEENFTRRHELGGACAVYYRGEKVVDLWGGVRHETTGEPWERDTMVAIHSATKGLAAMTLALAHSRGWIDYEARVADYWPEFASTGRARLPSDSCSPTRPDFSPSTSPSIAPSSMTLTGWRR
jgi:CubicO group peptidase (beta-lactamase class C family)